MPNTRHPRWILLVLSLLAFASAGWVHADLKTNQIKAAYLYQISKFVFWPANRKNLAQFQVCQFGDDTYDGTLDKMTGRNVFNQPVAIRRVDGLDQAEGCHLLILPDANVVPADKLIAWVKGKGILTVVEGAENLDHAMVAFVLENQRVRLHINLGLAEQAGLSFAANLLEVASHIKRGSP